MYLHAAKATSKASVTYKAQAPFLRLSANPGVTLSRAFTHSSKLQDPPAVSEITTSTEGRLSVLRLFSRSQDTSMGEVFQIDRINFGWIIAFLGVRRYDI